MRRLLFIVAILVLTSVQASQRVSVEELRDGGWSRYMGQYVQITTPLTLCGIYYDSLVLAQERLFVPEELAVGLADGDSTEYYRLAQVNREQRIRLISSAKGFDLRTGAVVRRLKARVVAPGVLETGATPHFTKKRASRSVPRWGRTDVRICSANIQNFFYHLGGYASRKTTRGQYELQKLKTATALLRMDADIYALCELEKGPTAPGELAGKMNELARTQRYKFVSTGAADGDTISVGYIYRADRVEPYGPPRFAYEDEQNIYAYRFMLQGWRELKHYELFYISLNHLRSKRGTPEESARKRMANVDSVLMSIDKLMADECYRDSDVLLLGDYNSYTQEQPIQAFVRAGYEDMLPAGEYSYVYNAESGFLDRVFASPSMAKMVVGVQPVHWNADTHYTYGYKSKYNYKDRVIPTESPEDIRMFLSRQARRNMLFRYADHDPILIGVRFALPHTE